MCKFGEANLWQNKNMKQLTPDTRCEEMPRSEQQMCRGGPSADSDGGMTDRREEPPPPAVAEFKGWTRETGGLLAHLIPARKTDRLLYSPDEFFFAISSDSLWMRNILLAALVSQNEN